MFGAYAANMKEYERVQPLFSSLVPELMLSVEFIPLRLTHQLTVSWHAQAPAFACRPSHIVPDLEFPPYEWWAHGKVASCCFFGLSPAKHQEPRHGHQALSECGGFFPVMGAMNL